MTPQEIESATNKLSAIEQFNKKIQILRKRQLYGCLKEGTKLRGELTKKLRGWIQMLESRLFDPQTMKDLDIRQVISLFKYLGQYSIQLMDQVNDVEGLLKAYTDSEKAVDKLVQSNNQTNIILTPEQSKIKSELIRAVVSGLAKDAEEAVVTKTEKIENVIEIEDKKLMPEKIAAEEKPKIPVQKPDGDIELADLDLFGEDTTDCHDEDKEVRPDNNKGK